ncbi:hypothetical protein FB451DRAFT_1184178 [Mycena latifolia]|nr:hypothetical protein FB451DRAFT_1184178 [Mycena latifolia]
MQDKAGTGAWTSTSPRKDSDGDLDVTEAQYHRSREVEKSTLVCGPGSLLPDRRRDNLSWAVLALILAITPEPCPTTETDLLLVSIHLPKPASQLRMHSSSSALSCSSLPGCSSRRPVTSRSTSRITILNTLLESVAVNESRLDMDSGGSRPEARRSPAAKVPHISRAQLEWPPLEGMRLVERPDNRVRACLRPVPMYSVDDRASMHANGIRPSVHCAQQLNPMIVPVGNAEQVVRMLNKYREKTHPGNTAAESEAALRMNLVLRTNLAKPPQPKQSPADLDAQR